MSDSKKVSMGGEGEAHCMQCDLWVDPVYTCQRCRLHTCVECSERLEKREAAMTKRLDLDWSKVELCCMCLDILNIKVMANKKQGA